MTVRLDLRLNREDSAPANRFGNVAQVVLFFVAMVHVLMSAAFFIMSIHKLSFLREKRTALTVEAKTAALDLEEVSSRIKRAVAKHDVIAENIDFVLSGIPALEFMRELEALSVDNVCVEAVSLASSDASIQGVSSNDADVLVFSERIESFRSVRGVSVPSITVDDKMPSALKRFSIKIELAELHDLLLYCLGESALDSSALRRARHGIYAGVSE